MQIASSSTIRVADGVWVAVALLHRDHPDRADFSEAEIQARFLAEGLPRGKNPSSLPTNINSHCVANRPRSHKKTDSAKLQGGAYRLLYETRSGFRRLFRPTDDVHPDRWLSRGQSKALPLRDQIPERYRPLLDWYDTWVSGSTHAAPEFNVENDPLLRLRGSGRHIWADEHADEYVENLRREDD